MMSDDMASQIGEARLLSGGGEDGFTFEELYSSLIFLVCLWVAGKLAKLACAPPLVGEIIAGILLGPYVANFVPYVSSWKLVGDMSLMLLVVEAGLDVDLALLKLIGLRGALVAIVGSLLPLGIGFLLAFYVLGLEMQASFIVGASFAPTSMGIALNVLRSGKMLNTPIGQLVIAAAILDDIIALVLLSEIEVLENPSAWGFIQPILVALALVIGFGCFAIFAMPIIVRKVLSKVSEEKQGTVLLGMVLALAIALAPLARAAGSSYLLGCFIAGVCFCNQSAAHTAWIENVEQILTWLLRVFFACTIGFEVPVTLFWDAKVVADAFILLVAIIGKLVVGFLASPLTRFNVFVISFAMSAWGEFAFIVVLHGKSNGLISDKTVASVILAIMISVIVSPILLRAVIVHYTRASELEVEEISDDMALDGHLLDDNDKGKSGSESEKRRPLYYFVQATGPGNWGEQDRILRALVTFPGGLRIVDVRSQHTQKNRRSTTWPARPGSGPEDDFSYNANSGSQLEADEDMCVMYEVFVKDESLTTHDVDKVEDRLQLLFEDILAALRNSPDASVRVGRWRPGKSRISQASSIPKKVVSSSNNSNSRIAKRNTASCRRCSSGTPRVLLSNSSSRRKRIDSHGDSIAALPVLASSHDSEFSVSRQGFELYDRCMEALDGFVNGDSFGNFAPSSKYETVRTSFGILELYFATDEGSTASEHSTTFNDQELGLEDSPHSTLSEEESGHFNTMSLV